MAPASSNRPTLDREAPEPLLPPIGDPREGSRRSRHLCTEGWRQTPPTSDQSVRGPPPSAVGAGRFKSICIGIGQNDRRVVCPPCFRAAAHSFHASWSKPSHCSMACPGRSNPGGRPEAANAASIPRVPDPHIGATTGSRLAAQTLEPSLPRETPAKGILAITPVSSVNFRPPYPNTHAAKWPNTDQPPPRIDRDQNQDDVPCDPPCDRKGRPSPVDWRTWNCESWDA